MKWIVPSCAFTAKVMKMIHEGAHRKKTPILKDGVPTQPFVIFYLLVVFTSYLHRWSTGSGPTSQNNQTAKVWFCFESAAFWTFYRRGLSIGGNNISKENPGDNLL